MTLLPVDEILPLITKTLDFNKAEDIVTIPLAGKADYADYLVIASGTTSRHCISLSRYVEQKIRKTGFKETLISGKNSGDWVVMDVGDVIVHLFRPEVRAFYNLEKLWQDPPTPA